MRSFQASTSLSVMLILGIFTISARSLEIGSAVPSFTVVSPEGEPLGREQLLGKLSVIFYDTRFTASSNNDLKYALVDFRNTHPSLFEDLQILQIIDASSANFFTRTIWKRKIRENARRYGITIYADWSGKMRRDFGFHPDLSNVLVVDAQGVVRYVFSGKVPESERNALFTLLLHLGKAQKRDLSRWPESSVSLLPCAEELHRLSKTSGAELGTAHPGESRREELSSQRVCFTRTTGSPVWIHGRCPAGGDVLSHGGDKLLGNATEGGLSENLGKALPSCKESYVAQPSKRGFSE
jgi:alkyl hydroperoxide reductase subunit AhpC